MKKLKGKFYRYNGAPAAGTILSFELSQAATVIATREELEARGNTPHTQNRGVIHIELDENGCVPASAEIYANDELHPLTAYYVGGKWSEGPYEMPQNITAVRPEQPQDTDDDGHIRVDDSRAFGGWYRIIGESPIDITSLVPLPAKPDYDTSRLEVPRRSLPAVRRAGTNYCGFAGGTVYPPLATDVCALPSLAASAGPFGKKVGAFSVYAFTLPTRAIVSRVSVVVDTPKHGRRVIVGLYDAAGKRRCAASIDASKCGAATGVFESDVTLDAGGLYLAWAETESGGVKLTSIGSAASHLDLANEGEGAIVLGTVAVPDGTNTLPERLGTITPTSSFVPPLTWFKA